MRILLRSLALLVVVAGCGGAQNPPPPVATATPATSAGDVQPLSSREAAQAPTASGGASVDPNATLPPGHPPISGGGSAATAAADPHGNVATAGLAKSAGSITGTISLSPKLESSPSDVLYVMAKKGKTTLAVKRVSQPAFPYDFEVSGTDSMMGGVDFVGPVDLVARVSRTGDAIPAKGDLEGLATGVKIPATAVKLTIDSVRQ